MLKVIEGTKKQEPNLLLMHLNALYKAFYKHESTNDRADLGKMVYHGVKAANLYKDDAIYSKFEFIELVRSFIAMVTPTELVRLFPPIKTYDGERWGIKDYFTVTEALKGYAPDEPIGENLDELLWDYMNRDLNFFMVNMMCIVSDISRMETGKGLMEKFCEDNGIDTLTMSTDPKTDKQFMTNNTTGETTRVYKAKPRYLKSV